MNNQVIRQISNAQVKRNQEAMRITQLILKRHIVSPKVEKPLSSRKYKLDDDIAYVIRKWK